MTKKNNIPDKSIPCEYLVHLVNLTHSTLQQNKDLLYDVKYDQDLYIVYENNSPIVSCGGIWTPEKKYWPETIRIYAPLGQQIHNDLNCEIRLAKSSIFGHTPKDFFSLTYYTNQGVAYGAIPDSECDRIKSEIFQITKTHNRIAVR